MTTQHCQRKNFKVWAASLHHGPVWQEQIQCRCGVGLSSLSVKKRPRLINWQALDAFHHWGTSATTVYSLTTVSTSGCVTFRTVSETHNRTTQNLKVKCNSTASIDAFDIVSYLLK